MEMGISDSKIKKQRARSAHSLTHRIKYRYATSPFPGNSYIYAYTYKMRVCPTFIQFIYHSFCKRIKPVTKLNGEKKEKGKNTTSSIHVVGCLYMRFSRIFEQFINNNGLCYLVWACFWHNSVLIQQKNFVRNIRFIAL